MRGIDVLLLDGECRQSLACMRTYARNGLKVGAVACDSYASWAPSSKSRLCSLHATAPDYATNGDGYIEALLTVTQANSPRMLLPAHDGSIEALRAHRAEFQPHVVLPLANECALDIAVSKARTLTIAKELGIPTPRSVRASTSSDVKMALQQVGLPAVVKPERSWVAQHGGGTRLSSVPVRNADEASRTLDWVFSAGGDALIQQWLPGRREAVSVLYARDRFWARLAQVSHREWPLLGGASVLCETIPLPDDITAHAEALVRAINLDGCSMVEFRRDGEDRPVLMEVNPRMGGSVELAISAGVDFPMLLYDWNVHGLLHEVSTYQTGRRLRWLAGDIWNLKCTFDSQGQPDAPPRGQATRRFVVDFFNPANRLDTIHLDDMLPAVSEMNGIVFSHTMHRANKLVHKAISHVKGDLIPYAFAISRRRNHWRGPLRARPRRASAQPTR